MLLWYLFNCRGSQCHPCDTYMSQFPPTSSIALSSYQNSSASYSHPSKPYGVYLVQKEQTYKAHQHCNLRYFIDSICVSYSHVVSSSFAQKINQLIQIVQIYCIIMALLVPCMCAQKLKLCFNMKHKTIYIMLDEILVEVKTMDAARATWCVRKHIHCGWRL